MVFTYIYPPKLLSFAGTYSKPYIESFSVRVWHSFKLFSKCSGCDWSESHPLWIFSSTRLWRPGHRKNVQPQVPAGSWISIDSDIVSCNSWDVWDSQNTQKRFLAVNNYFKEMVSLLRLKMSLYVTWVMKIQLWYLHRYTKRMADVLVPTTTRHEHVDRRYRN